MPTSEVVVRMAMDGLGKVGEIWDWPLHYFLAVRQHWIVIKGLAPGAEQAENGVTRRTVGPGITVETFETPG